MGIEIKQIDACTYRPWELPKRNRSAIKGPKRTLRQFVTVCSSKQGVSGGATHRPVHFPILGMRRLNVNKNFAKNEPRARLSPLRLCKRFVHTKGILDARKSDAVSGCCDARHNASV